MSLLLLVLFIAIIALVSASGEISITNYPAGPIHCGDPPYTLMWTYSSDAMNYFTGAGASQEVDIIIQKYNFVGSNDMLATLATVQYPTAQAVINWPGQWPSTWLTASSAVLNDGSSTSYYIQVQSKDGSSATSHCGFFCTESTFDMSCCPTGNPCGTNQMCAMGSCSASAAAGTIGGACLPNNVCNSGAVCIGSKCQSMASACTPGTLNCICTTANTCTTGVCTQGICAPGSGTAPSGPVAGTPCTPGSKATPVATCAGAVAPTVLACVSGQCTACTTGSADCACAAGACNGTSLTCAQGRCVPNTGCLNCACSLGVCNPGLTCMNNICLQGATQAPVTTGATATKCQAGSLNCACAMVGSQYGCLSPNYMCVNNICQNANRAVLAALAALVALLAALF